METLAMRLRKRCSHDRYESHFLVDNLPCSGGAFLPIDAAGGTRTIWWCENHEAEQVDGGYNLCFRGRTHFPTVEAEQHECRFVEMELHPIQETSNV